jgi:hypothetical protein
MSTVLELIDQVRQAGATLRADPPDLVITPSSRVSQELKERLRKVIAVLARAPEDLNAWRNPPLSELEQRHVAIKIESERLWNALAGLNEDERQLADRGGPVYTVQEARRLIGLPPPLVRQIHSFKKTFGGTVETKLRGKANND